MLFMTSSNIYSLNAFGKTCRDLAEVMNDTAVTKEALMKLPQLLNLMYNDKNVIID